MPIIWQVLAHGSSAVSYATYQELLDKAALLLPAHGQVVLLADRGFADTDLMRHLQRLGWHLRIRIKSNFCSIYRRSHARCQPNQLELAPGQAYFWHRVWITAQRFGPVHVALARLENGREYWFVVSDEPTGVETFDDYGRRFSIEMVFTQMTKRDLLAFGTGRVSLFNRSPARIEPVRDLGGIQVTGEVCGFARIAIVTTDPAEALRDADLVMVVVPAVGHREMAALLGPHLQDGQVVILNPGRTGGALEFAAVLREKQVSAYPIVAEAQTLLYASRDIDPASVRVFSVKNAVPVAALPAYLTPDVLAVTGKCLPYFVAGDNVLKTGLSNIGAVFHPALTLLNAAFRKWARPGRRLPSPVPVSLGKGGAQLASSRRGAIGLSGHPPRE